MAGERGIIAAGMADSCHRSLSERPTPGRDTPPRHRRHSRRHRLAIPPSTFQHSPQAATGPNTTAATYLPTLARIGCARRIAATPTPAQRSTPKHSRHRTRFFGAHHSTLHPVPVSFRAETFSAIGSHHTGHPGTHPSPAPPTLPARLADAAFCKFKGGPVGSNVFTAQALAEFMADPGPS